MKKRQRQGFPSLPSSAWHIRRREAVDAAVQAVGRAVDEAGRRGFAKHFDDLDAVLRLAEPWVDCDVLRAHLLGDGDPEPGTKFAIAFIPADGDQIENHWYVLPPARAGQMPLRIVAMGLNEVDYAALTTGGFEGLYRRVLNQLRTLGAGPD